MFQGQLVGIYIAEHKRVGLMRVEEVQAISGKGLAGDRFFRKDGLGTSAQEVTLIEIEAIEALALECGISLEPGKARRNLVTRDVPLNHLVGKEFRIGEVFLRGLGLCEPCHHLEALTVKGIKDGLCHRGGLRAQVVRGGTLRKGDIIGLGEDIEN